MTIRYIHYQSIYLTLHVYVYVYECVFMYMGPYLLMASVKAVRALQLKKTNIMRMEKHGGTLSLKLNSFFLFRIYLFL